MRATLVTGTRYLDPDMGIDLAPGGSTEVPDDRSEWSARLVGAVERGKVSVGDAKAAPKRPPTSRGAKSRTPLTRRSR